MTMPQHHAIQTRVKKITSTAGVSKKEIKNLVRNKIIEIKNQVEKEIEFSNALDKFQENTLENFYKEIVPIKTLNDLYSVLAKVVNHPLNRMMLAESANDTNFHDNQLLYLAKFW